MRSGFPEQAEWWAARAHENSKDLALAVGYRNSMQVARLILRLGQTRKARHYFREALDGLNRRRDYIMAKASGEAFAIALRHPAFLLVAFRSDIDKSAIMMAVNSLVRQIVHKIGRKLLAA